MSLDIRKHPDAPDVEQLSDVIVEPVAPKTIERHRTDGQVLVEDDVREREDLDVHAHLSEEPGEAVNEDVGTALYRLVQLFGTPQLPEYRAGTDLSERDDTTFKYLLRARLEESGDELPNEWLITVQDWHVELGVSVAAWRDEPVEFTADAKTALASLALAHNIVNQPVQCEYKDIPF